MSIVSKSMMAGCLVWGVALAGRAAEPGVSGSSMTVGSGTNETHVTAHRADYEISKNILVLDGDVVVRDPRVTIKADQITMVMSTNREPEMLTAVGHVVIEQDLNPVPTAGAGNGPKPLAVKGFRRAVCGRAVYGVRSGVTVLTDKPVITQEGMTLSGSRIIYSRDQDKVHIDNSEGTFVPGAGQASGMGDLLSPKKSGPKTKE
jgi:lipopolysaccharide export system protein LptA